MGEGEAVTVADIYAAECEACRLEALYEEAQNHANRLRIEYHAAIRYVRELVRAAGESGGTVEGERTLFDTAEGT